MEMDMGTFPGDGNPITSAVSSMAHIVHTSEARGIDAG
ncbi:3-hydroxyisobutyrate dehydrogenase [Micromonospora sp. B006]|nr:3-hydroxyisobutyrate dehydrogenase [Micromonospora sp. B006]